MNGAALEPVTRRFVAALMAAGGPPIYTLSPADARALLAGQQSVFAAKPDARIKDATFPVGPKGAVRVRIIRPKNSERALPVIMHVLGDVKVGLSITAAIGLAMVGALSLISVAFTVLFIGL